MTRRTTTLFLQHQGNGNTVDLPIDKYDVSPVLVEELLEACRKIGEYKFSGPDGVPNLALKLVIGTRPEMFLDVLRVSTKKNISSQMEKLRLVLLPKAKVSAYRSICLIDTAGKVLERIVCDIINSYIETQ